MSKLNVVALSLASLALAATATAANAGTFPPAKMPAATKPATTVATKPATTVAAAAQKDAGPRIVNGFEYIGGETGWQPAQHRFAFSNGRLIHTEECDHAIRTAEAVPPIDEMETLRRRYPGG